MPSLAPLVAYGGITFNSQWLRYAVGSAPGIHNADDVIARYLNSGSGFMQANGRLRPAQFIDAARVDGFHRSNWLMPDPVLERATLSRDLWNPITDPEIPQGTYTVTQAALYSRCGYGYLFGSLMSVLGKVSREDGSLALYGGYSPKPPWSLAQFYDQNTGLVKPPAYVDPDYGTIPPFYRRHTELSPDGQGSLAEMQALAADIARVVGNYDRIVLTLDTPYCVGTWSSSQAQSGTTTYRAFGPQVVGVGDASVMTASIEGDPWGAVDAMVNQLGTFMPDILQVLPGEQEVNSFPVPGQSLGFVPGELGPFPAYPGLLYTDVPGSGPNMVALYDGVDRSGPPGIPYAEVGSVPVGTYSMTLAGQSGLQDPVTGMRKFFDWSNDATSGVPALVDALVELGLSGTEVVVVVDNGAPLTAYAGDPAVRMNYACWELGTYVLGSGVGESIISDMTNLTFTMPYPGDQMLGSRNSPSAVLETVYRYSDRKSLFVSFVHSEPLFPGPSGRPSGQAPPLRLKQRNDNLGLTGGARLPLVNSPTSEQGSASPRVAGRSQYL